jgi:hypothetical protein
MKPFYVSIEGEYTLEKKLASLNRKANGVMSKAANRALSKASAVATKETTKEYLVLTGKVRDAQKKVKASSSGPMARLIVSGKKLNMYEYRRGGISAISPRYASQNAKVEGVAKRPKVYKGKIKKETSRKPFSKAPKAFVQVMPKKKSDGPSNVIFVHRVSSDPRSKLVSEQGLSVPEMVSDREILTKVLDESQETLVQRMEHEISRII